MSPTPFTNGSWGTQIHKRSAAPVGADEGMMTLALILPVMGMEPANSGQRSILIFISLTTFASITITPALYAG